MSVEDVLNAAKERLDAILAPINGGVGEDASYDEAFEAIKTELDRGSSIEGGSTDWKAVENKSYELLAERSKDFRVALYYTAAATQNRQLAGLFDGIFILNELSKAFWEPMYPALKRPRARGALCAWLSEVATPTAQAIAPTAQDRDMVNALEGVFRELDGLLADKLGDAYPGMTTLRDAVRNMPRRVPAEAPPPPPPPPPKPAAAPAAPAAGPASQPMQAAAADYGQPSYEPQTDAPHAAGGLALTEIYDAQTAYQALAEIAPVIGRASDAILQSMPASADGYRLARVAAWLTIGGAPYNEGGQTQLDGPGEHVAQALADAAAGGDWMGLASSAAQVAAEYPLYLDAVRFLALALEQQGADYAVARTAVLRETAALLARAPEIVDFFFANGVPFASAETKPWAAGLATGGGGGGGGAGRSPVDKAVADAEKLAAEGQINQAVGLLSRVANQVSSPAQKFKARLEIAKACLKAQIFDLARVQLESLERVAEEHRLAAWDPELCAEMYANLYRARRAQAAIALDDPEVPKKMAHALAMLTELDAAQALLATQEGAG